MRSTLRVLSGALLLGIAAGCQIDKLVDTPPTGVIIASPAAVAASAAAGSTAPRSAALALRSAHSDAIDWSATHTGDGHWLTIADGSGTTPDSLHLALDPSGLAAGSYRDTLVLTPDDPGAAPTRVPVTLTVEGCPAATITLGIEVDDSLRATDCASAHHPGRPARRYHFSVGAHDSASFHLTSAVVPVDLIVDTSAAGNGTPFAEATSCGSAGGACLNYLRLPAAGSYTVEVTSNGGAATGPFALTFTAPRTPATPDSLRQLRADSSTAISVGGAAPEHEFVVRAVLRDPDVGDALRLEIEVQAVGTAFTGDATSQSGATPNGGTAFVRLTGLTDGTSYHWRSRVVDQTTRATPWQSFGGNAESAVDLRVAVAANRLLFRQAPTTTMAGTAISPAVTVAAVDADGVTVPGFTGTIMVTLGGGPLGAALSGTRSVTAVNGVATFNNLSIDKVATNYTLLASSSGLIDATSPAFAVTPGAATRLAFAQQPTSSSPGAAITPAVSVTAYDGYGNVATSFTGGVTIALGHDGSILQNAQLGGTRTRNAAAGVATFADLTIDQLGGGYTLVASASGAGSITSSAFDIVPLAGSPSAQRFDQQPSGARAGEVISPAVLVAIVDGQGDPVTGFTDPVTLTLTGGPPGAVLGGTITQVPTSGVARFGDLTVDRPGTGYQLRASTTSLPVLLSSSFTIDSAAPTTGALTVVTHTTGTFADFDGYTVSVGSDTRAITINSSTTYTGLPTGPALVTLAGIASNCILSGDDPRTATVVAGGTVTMTFDIDCQPPQSPATELRFTVQPPATQIVGGTFGVVVAAYDKNGAVATSYTGRVSLALLGGLLGTTLSGTTAVDATGGIATFGDLRLTGACVACQLQANSLSLTGATSNAFTVVVP